MSQPTGRPDFLRTFAASRFFDVPFFTTTITQATTLPRYSVVNMDSVGVRCLAHTGHGLLDLKWWTQQTGGNFITSDQIALREGTTFDQSIVVKGSFLEITANNVEPADWNLTLVLYETTRSVISQNNPNSSVLINAAVNLGAGAGQTFTAARIWAGEAHWNVSSYGTNWKGALRSRSHLNVTSTIDLIIRPVAATDFAVHRLVFLPAERMEITIDNFAAGAIDIEALLIAKPGMSGM